MGLSAAGILYLFAGSSPGAPVPHAACGPCPDVVGDARATLARFGEWKGEVAAQGFPLAFVGQDRAEDLDVPWDAIACWFVGGSTRWKLSQASADLCGEARRRGKWVHMGRVNSMRRIRTAHDFGCDSIDGSGYSRFAWSADSGRRPDMALSRYLAYIAALEGTDQRPLFKESAK